MANIVKTAAAGTLESSDAYVEIAPAAGTLQVEIDSVVKGQFGDKIEAVVRSVLEEYGISEARISVADRGALDCVLRARVETAVLRGRGDV